MSRALCMRCGLQLDPDAPGAGCPVCLGEQPSPVRAFEEPGAVSIARRRVTESVPGSSSASARRPSARAPISITNLARVSVLAASIASAEGRELEARDVDLAAAIARSKVEA